MFQFDWGIPEQWSREGGPVPRGETRLAPDHIQGAMLLHWQEHCVECAIPHCYGTCPLYVPRADRKCARLAYGMIRHPGFTGLFPWGADLRFRRWGKIEALLTGRLLSSVGHRRLDRADSLVTSAVSAAARLLHPLDPTRLLNGALTHYRGKALELLGHGGESWDAFVCECYHCGKKPATLLVELRKEQVSVWREALPLQPGTNFFSLPLPLPPGITASDRYELMLYPEGDREIRVIFTWLDIVVYGTGNERAVTVPPPGEKAVSGAALPAEKVKCVAWDLDNTLWEGILVEDGEENLRLRTEAVELIRALDERGIIQTIVSKNNHDEAMGVVKKHGLEEYFLYPAINWGQKSANLQQIADRLNINIDTFALVDDSPFERREVGQALPMVRTYPEAPLAQLLTLPEFEVMVTEASRMRRHSYLTEINRERASEHFAGDYLEFLRSCCLKMRLFVPASPEEVARCLELIQRSNQLNLSSRRYTPEQFAALLADRQKLCVALECEDRFGSYGIVGFASIDRSGDAPVARDFVLSCRVAQKRVEHTFYNWLGRLVKEEGASRLLVELIKTPKNRPLVKVFEDLPFKEVKSDGDLVLLAMELQDDQVTEAVVDVDDTSFRVAAAP